MKKIVFAFVLFIGTFSGFSQEEETTEEEGPKEGWTKAGNIALMFNQSAFNNEWLGGGVGNIAGNLAISYDFNYLKGDWTWDNKILIDYGITKLKGGDTQKTNDRFDFTSLLGKKASGNWYYSMFLNFKTQMDSGFLINEDGSKTKLSHFFSPAYLQIGPGMLWKKSDNLKVNISPATARFIFVHSEFTDGLPDGITYFGVEGDETTRFEFGASLSGYAKFDIMKNVSIENILNLYTNYLEDPQNVDLDYTMNLAMTVNKYLSANLTFQAIYDDNAIRAFQIREMFGAGINYGF